MWFIILLYNYVYGYNNNHIIGCNNNYNHINGYNYGLFYIIILNYYSSSPTILVCQNLTNTHAAQSFFRLWFDGYVNYESVYTMLPTARQNFYK